jgi:hypothetical protein
MKIIARTFLILFSSPQNLSGHPKEQPHYDNDAKLYDFQHSKIFKPVHELHLLSWFKFGAVPIILKITKCVFVNLTVYATNMLRIGPTAPKVLRHDPFPNRMLAIYTQGLTAHEFPPLAI